ncbi:FeoB-associated Cys-rich membrane protein [Clostridium rectalis]|nr:FeoB-associated Cys-rich membrane protein [Clostridium rectalis]
MLQVIITTIIVIAAIYILYNNIKRKISGKCDCSSCSSHCNKNNK